MQKSGAKSFQKSFAQILPLKRMKILYLLYESLKGKIEDYYKFSHRFSCPDHKNCENCRPKCISGMGVRGGGVGSTICKYWNKFGGCSS